MDNINDLLIGATNVIVEDPKEAVRRLEAAKKLLANHKNKKATVYGVRVKALALELEHGKRDKYAVLKDIVSTANELKNEKIE
jgi:hypothetical protein